MDLGLKNKVALVTGASRGLGKTIALTLASEGVQVAVNYRRESDKAEQLVDEIKTKYGGAAISVGANVACETDVVRMFQQIESELGLVQVLINNAAVCPTRKVKDMSAAEWTETIAVNLHGTFLTSREMVRRLLAVEETGRIVNVASQAAFRGSTTGHAPYDASKGGMVSFTISLAREVAESGIAVNAVAPGMMFTEMTQKTLKANEHKYLDRIPLHRIAETSEIADVVVFLASNRASYMTGATVDVSGGMLMR
jgi:3-oxoacyl-[acyl-carrier protein] reductase